MSYHVSNNLTSLFEPLYQKLWQPGKDPFHFPYVVVASYGMKRWLKFEFAKRSVSFGLKIVALEEVFRTLFGPTFTPFDYQVFIYAVLDEIEEVSAYLEGCASKKQNLAQQLAKLFVQYLKYDPHIFSGWQREIFNKLPVPSRKVPRHFKEVHLFGFSYLSPLPFKWLQEVNANFYLFSPCQVFWSDESKQGGNPLLAHFGALGKEMSRQVDDQQIEAHYQLPEGDFSLLKALQCDLLFARKPQEQELVPFDDHSIEVHQVFSKRQEIEVCYDKLVEGFDQGWFSPDEVLVMAKDITPYVPYIHSFFGGEDSPLEPLIFDIEKGKNNLYYQALQSMVQWGQKGWDRDAFLEVVRQPKVQEKWGWNEENVGWIEGWLETFEIHFGKDARHREQLLQQEGFSGMEEKSERGTWKGGLAAMWEAISLEGSITSGQAPLAAQCMFFVEGIFRDLGPLLERPQTLNSWVVSLKNFIQEYLFCEEDEKWVELNLAIDALLTPMNQVVNALLPWSLIWQKIEETMEQKESVLGDHRLHTVTFSSLFPNRALPKKVIWLLGLDEGVFPKISTQVSIDLLAKRGGFVATPPKEDRFALLETMHAAGDFLYLSTHLEKGRSPLLQQLIDYLDHSFVIDEGLFSVNRVYTHEKEVLSVQNGPAPFFVGTSSANTEVLEVKDLLLLTKDPLKFYFKKTLNLSLPHLEVSYPSKEPLTLSPLDKLAWKRGEKRGLPLGAFHTLALKEMAAWEKEVPFFIEWHPACHEKEWVADNHLVLPPIEREGVLIQGVLSEVTPSGIVVDAKFDVSQLIKHYPKALLLQEAGFRPLYSFKGGKTWECVGKWAPFLHYAKEAKKYPSLGFPQWVRPIVEGKPFETKEVYSSLTQYASLPRGEQEVAKWQPLLSQAFEPVFEAL